MEKYKAELTFAITCICLSVFLSIISLNYSLQNSQHADTAEAKQSVAEKRLY